MVDQLVMITALHTEMFTCCIYSKMDKKSVRIPSINNK